ncbi:hypothetical protein D3C81_1315350 [compost metagenome]
MIRKKNFSSVFEEALTKITLRAATDAYTKFSTIFAFFELKNPILSNISDTTRKMIGIKTISKDQYFNSLKIINGTTAIR